jgi:hypothetical protein
MELQTATRFQSRSFFGNLVKYSAYTSLSCLLV